jgi:hypothetical protein
MHVILTTIFIVFFVICVLWLFTRKNVPDRLFAPSASLPVDIPVNHIIVDPIISATAENTTLYLKHSRKGCKTFVPFSTVTEPISEANFMTAINACENENIRGTSGYRCSGTVFVNQKWNSCPELELRNNNNTWVHAEKAKSISYIPKFISPTARKYLLRKDLGCKTIIPFNWNNYLFTLTVCDYAPACLGIFSKDDGLWNGCSEFHDEYSGAMWAKETDATKLSY